MMADGPSSASCEEPKDLSGPEQPARDYADLIVEPDQEKARKMLQTRHNCRVPGCTVPLTLYYNWRYRICADHRKSESVAIDDKFYRFCQLCGKFQQVKEFEGTKVSCEEALRLHNMRRRMNSRKRRKDEQLSGDSIEIKRTRSRRGGNNGNNAVKSEPYWDHSNGDSHQQKQKPLLLRSTATDAYPPSSLPPYPYMSRPVPSSILQPKPRRIGQVAHGFGAYGGDTHQILNSLGFNNGSSPMQNGSAVEVKSISNGFGPWANGQSSYQMPCPPPSSTPVGPDPAAALLRGISSNISETASLQALGIVNGSHRQPQPQHQLSAEGSGMLLKLMADMIEHGNANGTAMPDLVSSIAMLAGNYNGYGSVNQ